VNRRLRPVNSTLTETALKESDIVPKVGKVSVSQDDESVVFGCGMGSCRKRSISVKRLHCS
jgi:hypothetical protein